MMYLHKQLKQYPANIDISNKLVFAPQPRVTPELPPRGRRKDEGIDSGNWNIMRLKR